MNILRPLLDLIHPPPTLGKRAGGDANRDWSACHEDARVEKNGHAFSVGLNSAFISVI